MDSEDYDGSDIHDGVECIALRARNLDLLLSAGNPDHPYSCAIPWFADNTGHFQASDDDNNSDSSYPTSDPDVESVIWKWTHTSLLVRDPSIHGNELMVMDVNMDGFHFRTFAQFAHEYDGTHIGLRQLRLKPKQRAYHTQRFLEHLPRLLERGKSMQYAEPADLVLSLWGENFDDSDQLERAFCVELVIMAWRMAGLVETLPEQKVNNAQLAHVLRIDNKLGYFKSHVRFRKPLIKVSIQCKQCVELQLRVIDPLAPTPHCPRHSSSTTTV